MGGMRRRPSPALIVALVALVAALSGTSNAAECRASTPAAPSR
jgi:hypothetical protein